MSLKKATEVFGDQDLTVATFRLPRALLADLQYICARRGEQHRVVMAELVDQFVREHYDEVVQSARPHVNAGGNNRANKDAEGLAND